MPFYLRTGKRLPHRVTEIAIQFKRPPFLLFATPTCPATVCRPTCSSCASSRDEGISLRFEAKVPGPAIRLQPVEMDFSYGSTLNELPFSAYETLLLDCMVGDQTLFNRDDQVEEAWRVVNPDPRGLAQRAPTGRHGLRGRDLGPRGGRHAGGPRRAGLAAARGRRAARPRREYLTAVSPGRRDIEVLPDAETVARRGADLFALAAQEAAAARGAFVAALSGGETPRALYGLLARQQFAQKIPWRRVHLYWGDERCVPPDDERSNYRMAFEAFIGKVPMPADNVHRMRGEDEPDEAARAYERALTRPPALAASSKADLPVIDLLLLGLGADGHTASLFPHTPALREAERLVVVNEGEGTGKRLTVTYPVINAARHVVFVVTGGAKAGMVAEVLEGLRAPDAVPAQGVAPVRGVVTWLLDRDAASELSEAVV